MKKVDNRSNHVEMPAFVKATANSLLPDAKCLGPKTVCSALFVADTVFFPGNLIPLILNAKDANVTLKKIKKDRFVLVSTLKSETPKGKEKQSEPFDPTDFSKPLAKLTKNQLLVGQIGLFCSVQQYTPLEDGDQAVLLRCHHRAFLHQITKRQDMFGEVVASPVGEEDSAFNSPRLLNTMKVIKKLALQLFKYQDAITHEVREQVKSCEQASMLCYLILPYLSLTPSDKYKLLALDDNSALMKQTAIAIGQEIELHKLSSKIQRDVAIDLNEVQRRFFLNEQLRAIRRELGEIDEGLSDLESFQSLLENDRLPLLVKDNFKRELEKLSMLSIGSPEYAVAFNYLALVKELPWVEKDYPKPRSIRATEMALNRSHFGQERLKQRILEYLALIQHRQEGQGQILLLNGPPGVGKTSIAKTIALALNRPFARISLGGVKDEAELRGHRKTYIGAMPGKIIQAIKQTHSAHCVLVLDEIDKIGQGAQSDLIGALLEILDRDHHQNFTDHYLGLPFDLSKVIFIATANDADLLPQPLLDRMERLDISGYSDSEKIQIAVRHLVPDIRKDFHLSERQFKLDPLVLKEVIRFYTREAGVRQLKRELETLGRKVVRALMSKDPLPKFIAGKLSEFLGPIKYLAEPNHDVLPIGVAIGLAYTGMGGDILYIESSASPCKEGRGQLLVTGSLGKVMQESARTALSYLLAHAERLGFDALSLDQKNLHIHFPDGATPKDGPSAGVAIVCALLSLLTQRPLPADLVMTGEISLRGQILAVGGIREKLMAAHRYGKNRVAIPLANQFDLVDLPPQVLKDMNIQFISTIDELIQICFQRLSQTDSVSQITLSSYEKNLLRL